MPISPLSEAIREAYATAQSDVVYLDTLQISHPIVEEPIYIVADRVNHTLGLETGGSKLFVATGFRFILPGAGDNGLQELSLAIDNINRRPSEFVRRVMDSIEPVTVTYRPYLSTNLESPEMDPPLVLFLTDVNITAVEIVGRATFADVLNRKFLSELYTRRRFPGL